MQKKSVQALLKAIVYLGASMLCVVSFVMYAQQIGEAIEARGLWFDDAYMYIRYAQNIVSGYGFCWNNNTPPVYGCTDILFTYLLTLTYLLTNVSFEKIGVWLPVVNMGLLMMALPFALIRISQTTTSTFKFFVTTLVLSTLMLQPNILYHLFTGMDTVLAISANVFLIYSVLVLEKRKSYPRAVVAALAAYISYLIRPDNFFYVTIFPGLFFVFRLWQHRNIIFVFTGTYLLLFATDVVAKYYFFNDFLPLPFYVKSNGYFDGYMGESDWNPLEYLFIFLQYSFVWFLLIVVCFEKKYLPLLLVFFLPLFSTFVYFFDNVQIMGTAARYYLPSLPFVIFPAVILLSEKWSSEDPRMFWRNKAVICRLGGVVLFILLILQYSSIVCSWYATGFLQNRTAYEFDTRLHYKKVFPVYTTEYPNFFDLVKKLPPNTVIAAGENGKLAAQNPHVRIIDLNGLHEPFFAYNGFSVAWLMKQRPVIIQLTHYNITKINYDIVTNKEFQKQYDFYPNLFGFGVAVLKSNHNAFDFFKKEAMLLYGISDFESYKAHIGN